MRNLFFSMIALTAIAIFTISGCNKGGGDEILIGEYGSLTGPNATFGISSTNGLKLAVEELNNAGGLLNKKVKLITYDDQGKPSEAQTVVQRLIKNDNVVAVIGEVTFLSEYIFSFCPTIILSDSSSFQSFISTISTSYESAISVRLSPSFTV